jgi:hypothetical protein
MKTMVEFGYNAFRRENYAIVTLNGVKTEIVATWENWCNCSEDVERYNASYELGLYAYSRMLPDGYQQKWKHAPTLKDANVLAVELKLDVAFNAELFQVLVKIWDLAQKSKPQVF